MPPDAAISANLDEERAQAVREVFRHNGNPPQDADGLIDNLTVFLRSAHDAQALANLNSWLRTGLRGPKATRKRLTKLATMKRNIGEAVAASSRVLEDDAREIYPSEVEEALAEVRKGIEHLKEARYRLVTADEIIKDTQLDPPKPGRQSRHDERNLSMLLALYFRLKDWPVTQSRDGLFASVLEAIFGHSIGWKRLAVAVDSVGAVLPGDRSDQVLLQPVATSARTSQ